jgi:hypothetical protein
MPSRELQGHIPLTVEDKYLNILKIWMQMDISNDKHNFFNSLILPIL